jgi:hypothetical protein
MDHQRGRTVLRGLRSGSDEDYSSRQRNSPARRGAIVGHKG